MPVEVEGPQGLLAGDQWRGKKAQNLLLSSGRREPGPAVLGIVGVDQNNRPGSGRFEARAVSGAILFTVDAQRAVVGVNGGVGSTAQVDGQAGAIGTVNGVVRNFDDALSRRRSREICTGLLLSGFQSQDVGYRGAMVKEKPSVLPGLLFGLGFGGFVDGIVLHEILQRHHMISGAESSETLAGLELNVVADGFGFLYVVTWLLVMAGSIMTLVSWRQGRVAPT